MQADFFKSGHSIQYRIVHYTCSINYEMNRNRIIGVHNIRLGISEQSQTMFVTI